LKTHATKSEETGATKCYKMDEIETSAKTTLPDTKLDIETKTKIVSSLSDVIKFVVNDSFFNVRDAVAPLHVIIKMLTTGPGEGDVNNNKEVDIDDNFKVVYLSAPNEVELPNYLHAAAVNSLPLVYTDAALLHDSDDDHHLCPGHDVPGHAHHSISSPSLYSSSMSYSCSDISSDLTSDSDSDCAVLIGDDVADEGFLTSADLQCPECGQPIPAPHHVPLPAPDVQESGHPRQGLELYNLTWTEDADSGLLWCDDKSEIALTTDTELRPISTALTSKRYDIEESFNEVIDKASDCIVPYAPLAKVYQESGKLQEADELYKKGHEKVSVHSNYEKEEQMTSAPSPVASIVSEPLKVSVDTNSQPLDPRLVGAVDLTSQPLDPRLVGAVDLTSQALDPRLVGPDDLRGESQDLSLLCAVRRSGPRSLSSSDSADICSDLSSQKNILLRKDLFFTNVSNLISCVAPDFIFNKVKSEKRGKRRRAKEAAKVVPDEFRTLWRAMSEENTIIETPAPYPKVDWSCVNSRFIKNIPIPSSFPILGCSPDPDFYKVTTSYSSSYSKFRNQSNPFGSAYGYQTNQGIVCVSEEVHHGYVWEKGQWILHAKLPTQSQLEEKRGKREVQRMRRGKRGGRRGERGKRG